MKLAGRRLLTWHPFRILPQQSKPCVRVLCLKAQRHTKYVFNTIPSSRSYSRWLKNGFKRMLCEKRLWASSRITTSDSTLVVKCGLKRGDVLIIPFPIERFNTKPSMMFTIIKTILGLWLYPSNIVHQGCKSESSWPFKWKHKTTLWIDRFILPSFSHRDEENIDAGTRHLGNHHKSLPPSRSRLKLHSLPRQSKWQHWQNSAFVCV